jgi:methanol--5-hydroxybenzimidazolylcobamide Co-methyltransferase
MPRYTSLAISNPDDLRFGVAPHPLTTRHGLVIGGGQVYPEIKFTLPTMTIDEATWPEVRRHYQDIIGEVLRRAAELEAPGVVVEFETLPPMTAKADWGVEIAKILVDGIEAAQVKHGLKSVLRMTPNDNREMIRPPLMRSGAYWESMLATFAGAAQAGAELLSIESVGGKELHDGALIMADLPQSIFALSVLAVRDMDFLWGHIADIAKRHGATPAGDSACGFGNTAMVLAEQRMIPHVFAAVVRAVTAVRTLVAHERGAVGPGKDCAYENPILKAITGFPMAMEGKTAACAHFSPVGNIAAAACDLWSNESVQHLKLLAGMAPTVSMEMLIYDCRLMNQALKEGRASALTLRRWLVDSDAALDPQAYVLSPTSAIAIARAIVGADSYYHAAVAAASTAIDLLRDGHRAGQVKIAPREVPWLDRLRATVDAMPRDEGKFIAEMMQEVDTAKFTAQDYGLKA